MACVNKRILYVFLISLIVILLVTSITTGSYLMIKDLDGYKCGHVNIGIIVYISSIVILLISLIFKHKIFVCCFDTIYIGLISLIGSLITNGYIVFMIGHNNSECEKYYQENKEGDYYLILLISNMLLVILLGLYLCCK